MLRRKTRTTPPDVISESVLFSVLTLTERARNLSDDELAAEWDWANQDPDVTLWYHVVSFEWQLRDDEFVCGLRRGGSVRVPTLDEIRAIHHD